MKHERKSPARPKDVQLRNHDAVRSKQRKVGGVRKLGRRGLLDKRVRNHRVSYLGISEMNDYDDLPCSLYERGYMD